MTVYYLLITQLKAIVFYTKGTIHRCYLTCAQTAFLTICSDTYVNWLKVVLS